MMDDYNYVTGHCFFLLTHPHPVTAPAVLNVMLPFSQGQFVKAVGGINFHLVVPHPLQEPQEVGNFWCGSGLTLLLENLTSDLNICIYPIPQTLGVLNTRYVCQLFSCIITSSSWGANSFYQDQKLSEIV